MIKLGEDVEDIVTGFKGRAVAIHSYLFGCRRVAVQPLADDKNELAAIETFDEPQLKRTGPGIVKLLPPAKERAAKGGPMKYPDSRRA